ncbi:hypothetical protein BX616_010144 [Lobosporangium transversale]|nr:hypothetical protein BX616_010144 [Lobosporangium transversale]
MALFFQLAKIRRSPVPSTPSPSSSPWVFDIPEATRAILENLAEPLTVVSFFSYHRSIQDALCDAAATAAASASVIRNSYSSDTNNEQEQTNDTETTSTTSTTDIRLLGGGIWAWLSSPTSTMDSVSSSHPVHTLYVIYRHDNSISPNTLYDSTTENSAFSFPLHGILEPILALFSNQLNIVSPTIYDTEGDLARLARSLLTLQTTQRHYPPFDLPSLNWRWSDPVNRAISNSKAKSDHGHARGAATLEMYISDARKSTGVMSIESEDIAAQVAVLEQFFRSIKCCPSPASSKINNRAGGSIRKRRSKMNEQSIEAVLMRDLKDLTVTDTKKSNEAHIDSSWFHELTGRSKQRPDNQSTLTESQKATSGAVLYAKLQTYLTQLNGCSAPLNLSDLQQAARDAIRERALYNGAHTYHRIMNEHLDRQPIPLPWHTLAMLHHDAQSRSLEEIERRYYLGFEYYLPKLLGDFRTHCLKTTITDHASGKSAAATDANLVGATSALEMMVPTGGLYLEYYNANASALQNHHMVTLDEHWQVFKNRLLGNQRNSSSLASATVSPLTLRSSPDIKDYSDFLQAVDQVRRNYLETCIPSAEALSILENLDEMQQAESVIFLQSVANTAPNSALPTSPVTLSSHLKRCSSISSSTRQSLVLMNGSIGNIAGAGSASSADVLTDTLNGKSTSIQALASVNGNVDINSTSTSISRSATAQSLQQNEHAPTELEQQIAEIMMAKRRSKLEDNDKDSQDKELGSAGIESSSSTGNVDGSMSSDQKEHANSTVVQFGWTIHMLHANTLQYAWIWNWLYSHEGSSRQNVVACDSKTYTASKWIILPAKDIIRTRKDWKVKYGDRVWIISYWFSTRNTKIEMPEYLPRAQGAPCRHIVPYGETYVICKTCPADVLCMRCFRGRAVYIS